MPTFQQTKSAHPTRASRAATQSFRNHSIQQCALGIASPGHRGLVAHAPESSTRPDTASCATVRARPNPRCVAEVNLDAYRNNLALLTKAAAKNDCSIATIIKADGYGHGAVKLAKTAQDVGVKMFGVATLEEAIQLRENGIDQRVLVLGAPLESELPLYTEYKLDMMVSSPQIVDWLTETRHEPIRVHATIETGMTRMGLQPNEAPALIEKMSKAEGVELEGICTHMAQADVADSNYSEQQVDIFEGVVDGLAARSVHIPAVHFENSASLLNQMASKARIHRILAKVGAEGIARVGAAQYGFYADTAGGQGLTEIMTLKSQIRHTQLVKKGTTVGYNRNWTAPCDTLVGTMGVGYADGYSRAMSNAGTVRIGEHQYPVVGNVCMDMTMVNLGPPEGHGATVRPGDYAVLFGPQSDHALNPTASEVAAKAGTIFYETVCAVSKRVPRDYIDRTGSGAITGRSARTARPPVGSG